MTARKVPPPPGATTLAIEHPAVGAVPGDAQRSVDSQSANGVTDPSPESTLCTDANSGSVRGHSSGSSHNNLDDPRVSGAAGRFPNNTQPGHDSREAAGVVGDVFSDLRIWAESFADAQQTRIALVNRMERGGIDADLLQGHRDLLDASENAFRLAMVRSYRRAVREHMPAVEEWQKAHFGIGEHLLARLLGHLGHPVIAEPYRWMDEAPEGHTCIPERCGDRHLVALEPFARSLRQLWAYCGVGAPERRRKGMSQEDALALGKPQLKMLLRLLAEATIKCRPQPSPVTEATLEAVGVEQSTPPVRPTEAVGGAAGSPPPNRIANAVTTPVGDKFYYRRVYDARKETTGDRGWTDGHRHADALRIVSKEILRDLWTAAQSTREGHRTSGADGGPS